jgi:hypothetical protein
VRRRNNSSSKIDRGNKNTLTICAFCGEFERVNGVEEEKEVYCHCGENDDIVQRKEIVKEEVIVKRDTCTICGEEERFQSDLTDTDYCNCNVEL